MRRSATIQDEDACICYNFRADRVREITRALYPQQRTE
jgi:bisphosphoglycerate-independent phosphoglycerate mutase (AlkP superfamily)